jgi:hypothetical protein
MISTDRQSALTPMPTLARSFGIQSAADTLLRSAAWVDLHQLPPGAFSLVRELLKKTRPSSILDKLRQLSVKQSSHIQIFDGNQSVSRNQPVRKFVVKVGSLISHVSMNALQFPNSLASSIRSLMSPLYFPLCSPEFRLGILVPSRVFDFRSVRECRKRFQADINSDLKLGSRQPDGLDFASEKSVPPTSLAVNRACFDFPCQRSMDVDLDRAYLGEK